MYKVVYDNVVIDAIEVVRYGKYIPTTKRVIATDKSNANCIVASNLKDRYLLKGVPIPEGCPYIQVSLIPISSDEYYSIIESDIPPIESGIKTLKQHKINELRDICHSNIVSGIQIELSDHKLHHFEMSIEDQLNLLEIKYLIDAGERSFIYHETNGEYKEYSLEDMNKIIDQTLQHKQKHLLTFNRLKKKVNSLNNITEISNIKYTV